MNLLKEADKVIYLGQMYGLRAFYYFQFVSFMGDVVGQDQPSTGFEIGKLDKAASPAGK